MGPPRKDSREMGPVPAMEAGFPHKDTPRAALPRRTHCQEQATGRLAVAGTGQGKQGLSLPTSPPADRRGRNSRRPPGGTNSPQDLAPRTTARGSCQGRRAGNPGNWGVLCQTAGPAQGRRCQSLWEPQWAGLGTDNPFTTAEEGQKPARFCHAVPHSGETRRPEHSSSLCCPHPYPAVIVKRLKDA